nr:peptidoglycan editing factor PgeF [Aurantiacibacter aquimixticola]
MDNPRAIIRSEALGGVPHGFLTGIASTAEPDPARISPGAQLVLVKQVHSATALSVDAPFVGAPRPEADAMATATPGLLLGIVTADCAPVLFADREAGVVGAAHAGWRGAQGGVLEATVKQMETLGAERANIRAAIGPTIAQSSYEVDEDFAERFDARDARFFERGEPGKYQFDLPAYVRHRLEELQLAAVDDLGLDTYASEDRFHSYRRATHRGEDRTGRQFSLIALPG